MAKALSSWRDHFDIPEDVAYLNVATMGPLPKTALAAGEAGLARKLHPWTISSDDFFTDARRLRPLLAQLINADAAGIAIVPSASYGLATAAQNIPIHKNQHILVLADQFPSNVYTWRAVAEETGATVRTISASGQQSLSDALLVAITPETGIVAIPHVRWTDGMRLALEDISARCRAVGAALVLDISQSCGAMTFDAARIQPDFVVCVGYKWLLGPYGLGFMYAAPRYRTGKPLEQNWIARKGSDDFTRLINYQDEYGPGAQRFDMGERSNFALLPAFEASVSLLLNTGITQIESQLAIQNDALANQLENIGLATPPPSDRGPHYLSAALPANAPTDLTARLKADQVHVSQRGQNLRITPHLFNTDDDRSRLIESLRRHLSR